MSLSILNVFPFQSRDLIQAAANGDIAKVNQLLDRGVNVNAVFARDDFELSGMTALMAAAHRGQPNTVAQLIKRGAKVNLKRYTGDTALLLAAGTGNLQTIKILLAAGANPNVKVTSFHAGELTPLIVATHTGGPDRVQIVTALLDAKAQINPKGTFGMSPLMNAVEDLEILKLLIARGANVNQKNFRGATALMGAAAAGPPEVVRYLLEKGADANARDKDGYTALDAAQARHDFFDPSTRDEIIRILRGHK